uniref:L-amino-acid oxidase (Fragments) n=1 Tax=Naja oxiana TaxID=8657 RepID=OXLA_NAJOX|nr:RecName: Full=L-amino-acid oxidase; Short=LAAO; Short=LAO [Naja oxiana]
DDRRSPLEECFQQNDYEEFLEIARNSQLYQESLREDSSYHLSFIESLKSDALFSYEKKFWEADGIHGGKVINDLSLIHDLPKREIQALCYPSIKK